MIAALAGLICEQDMRNKHKKINLWLTDISSQSSQQSPKLLFTKYSDSLGRTNPWYPEGKSGRFPTCGSENARSGRYLETVWGNTIQSISRVESFAIFSRSNFGVPPEWVFLNVQTVSRTWSQSQSKGVSRTGPGGISCDVQSGHSLGMALFWNLSGYSTKVGLGGFISWAC